MDVRSATLDDLETLFDLYVIVFRYHIEEIWGWDEVWQRSRFKQDMELSSTSVVQIAGKTVGYVQTVIDSSQLYLRNIALLPDFQGQGIGTQLVNELQQESTDRKIPIKLSVFRTNPRAQEFYVRLGFLRTGETDAHIEMTYYSQ